MVALTTTTQTSRQASRPATRPVKSRKEQESEQTSTASATAGTAAQIVARKPAMHTPYTNNFPSILDVQRKCRTLHTTEDRVKYLKIVRHRIPAHHPDEQAILVRQLCTELIATYTNEQN